MNNNEQVLLESPAARNAQLVDMGSDRAEEILNKAKSLHLALWQGTGAATTQQIAEFYEVSIKTVESALKYHRSEFDSDGLKVLRGEDLKLAQSSVEFVTLNFKVTSKTRNLIVWNPRATIRLGFLLRDSEIAKAVRTIALNIVEQAPQQTQVSPKTTAEMLVVYAQQMVDQERRIQTVEAKVEQIEQRSIDAAQSLNLLPAPTEIAPPLTERDSLRKLINAWCQANNVSHQAAWRSLYNELYLRDGFSVNARIKNSKAASKLELVAESGKLGVLYAIATEIFPRTVIG
jgi:hypothetical protein